MSNETIYYVYAYAYIRSKDSATAKAGTPYYIGKGKGKRAFRKGSPSNKNNILLLETDLCESDTFALERWLIASYGRKDQRSGILINLTDGEKAALALYHHPRAIEKDPSP